MSEREKENKVDVSDKQRKEVERKSLERERWQEMARDGKGERVKERDIGNKRW